MTEIRDKLLRVSQVADRLNASKSQVYWLINVGELDLIKIGATKGYRVPESSVERYVKQQISVFYEQE